MKAVTIANCHDLADVRVLADSYSTYHSGEQIAVVLLDDLRGGIELSGENFALLQPADVGIPNRELHHLAAIYGPDELKAAVKPWVLRHLLDAGAQTAIYLDPGVEVLSPLDEVAALAEKYGVVIAPLAADATAGDDSETANGAQMEPAVFQQPFLAVSPEARPMLDRWSEAPRHEGEIIIQEGEIHNWSDSFPANYGHFVNYAEKLRTNGANLDERRIAEPCGFDSAANGFRIDEQVRGCCRYFHTLDLSDPIASAQAMPDPYDSLEADAFIDWLNAPDPRHPATISRYLVYLYEQSPDLKTAFPNLWRKEEARSYLQWASRGGSAESRIPPELIPTGDITAEEGDDSETVKPQALKPGFNIAGYMNVELGLGEAARLMVGVMEAGHVPHSVLPPFDIKDFHTQDHFPDGGVGEAEFDTSLICINASELPDYIDHVGRDFLESRYTIGFWGWEVEIFPAEMAQNAEFLDEIWVYAPHVQKIIAPMVEKPVYVCPLPVRVPEPPRLDKAHFGLPGKFMFYYSFDYNSSIERKNPEAVIEAFKRAFSPDEGPILLVKGIRGERAPGHVELLQKAAAGRSDIILMDCFLPRDEQNALMNLCDAYVSLHRAEGFGLTLAEAMALGKPVIATAYSGNLVFMNDENSFLVPYSFTKVPPNSGQYPVGARWADPDIEVAAGLMRRIHEDPGAAREKAEKGRRDILDKHSPEARVKFVLSRLAEIQREGKSRPKKNLPARRAASLLRDGVDVNGPTNHRRLVPFIRRTTLRLLKHYDVHQRQTGIAMLEAIRELEARVAQLAARERLDEQDLDGLRRLLDRLKK